VLRDAYPLHNSQTFCALAGITNLRTAAQVMFAQPMPAFSARMNAWATALTCQWLMGKCTVVDVELEGGRVGGLD
jgi:hypothetical protein